MSMCKKCCGMTGGILLVLGLCFLLVDLAVWDFWNIHWWTAIFVVMGVGCLACRSCPDCQSCSMDMKKKK